MVTTPSGVRLCVRESGPEAGPPVVALHGLVGTRESTLRGSDLQSAGYRAIAYDARGHGGSEAPADPHAYGYDLLVDDLVAVMEAHDASSALLVGASMGALTSLRLALERPERVAGVVVITPACGAREVPVREHVDRGDRLAAALRAGDLDAFLASQPLAVDDFVPSKTVRKMAAEAFEQHRDLDSVADAVQAVMRSRALDSPDALERVGVPTIVLGSRDRFDPSHPYELARSYAEALPGSRLVCERDGRLPLAWRAKQVARLVLDFAAEIGYGPAAESRAEAARAARPSPAEAARA
jgi:pimeloyl-ACP methyl ester carboxylesterase